MSQTTIFSDKFFQELKERQAKGQSADHWSKIIWKLISKENHWKVQILTKLNKNLLEKFQIQIESISEKQITFNLPHPALLERVKSIQALLTENIQTLLQENCSCGNLCKSRPRNAPKLVFFVKYKNPFKQEDSKTNLPKKSTSPIIGKSEVTKVSKSSLNLILEKYRNKIS